MPKLHRVRKNIYTLRPGGNEWASANVNILKAEKPALIDCGYIFGVGIRYLKRVLKSLDIKKIDKIIITHSHIDHCQNAGQIRAEFDAEIVAHRKAIPILKQSKHGYNAFEYWELVEEAFPRIFQSRLSGLYRRLILMGYNYFVKRFSKRVDNIIGVKEGDVIDLGDLKLEVLFTPGHSDDSISLLEKEQKILFTGDMIPWTPYIHTSVEDFRNSIRKIMSYTSKYQVQTLVRGHQRPQDATTEINNYEMFLEDMDIAERRIIALLKKKSPLTSKQMLPYIFRRSHIRHQLIYRIFMRTQQFWIAKYLQNLELKHLIKSIKEGKETLYSIDCEMNVN